MWIILPPDTVPKLLAAFSPADPLQEVATTQKPMLPSVTANRAVAEQLTAEEETFARVDARALSLSQLQGKRASQPDVYSNMVCAEEAADVPTTGLGKWTIKHARRRIGFGHW